jgi:polar amino acid transport system substrate-binding protein
LSAGWPELSDVAVVTRKGSGLAGPVSQVLNASIEDGSLAKILARWGLADEILPRSEVNPRGLPKY